MLTSLWVFYKSHRNHLGTIVLGLLLFVAGFQAGKVTSPYYSASPIIFNDRECNECSSSGGSRVELDNLKEEGIAQRQPSKNEKPVATNLDENSNQVIAGATTEIEKKAFVGSKNSDLFHDPSCSSAGRINEANQVWFASQADAESAGYSPSKCTKDKLGI